MEQRGAVDGECQSELGLNLGAAADGPLGSCTRGVVATLRCVDGSGSTARFASGARFSLVSDHPGRTLHRPAAGWFDHVFSGVAVGSDPSIRIVPARMGTIVESIPSIRADHRALQQRSAKDGQQSSRQRALERRLRDRVWPWSFAHAVLPFAGIYYAITRRTITPLLWDFVARFVVLLITSGVFLIFQRFSDAETVNSWIPLAVFWVFWVLIVVNVFAGLLPVRVAIRRTQADARRRLEAHG